MLPSRVTATIDGVIFIRILHIARISALAISTETPFCNIGVTTMKMISRHQHDVRHGNDVGRCHLRPDCGFISHGRLLPGAAAQDEVVDQLHRGVIHFHVESFDFVGEVVVGPHGRHGYEQAECGGNQGFRDTAGDCGKAGRFGRFRCP